MDGKSGKSAKLWGGRFQQPTDRLVEEYTQSVSFDHRLYAQDIAGSKAHARMLASRGIITPDEAREIERGLDMVLAEIESGNFAWKQELEDVHMNIEARLTELIGEPGPKLHTGRSRNDQVALDFRLFVSESISRWESGLRRLVSVLAARAGEHAGTLLPGHTHLQPAQPVSLAQHLLAYAWMFRRDAERLADAQKRVRVSPLGAAALAGATYPLAPEFTANELGLPQVFDNSLDAVSDRDFVLEALFCASCVMAHLSRLCEEIILWANPGFGFVALPDAFATGSSIMPQKKNPDVAELMRGKTGRVYGDLVAVLTMLKGLPLAYNRDMQEDKEPFLDADATVGRSLEIMARMAEALKFNEDAMRRALDRGFVNATELADYLVSKGMAFRDAHHVAGAAVGCAESRGKTLLQLSIEEYRNFSSLIGEDVYQVLEYEAAVARRKTHGGTGPESVARQIADLEAWLGETDGKAGGA